MRWLLVEMWAYLAIAFVFGMAVYRWVFGAGNGLAAEDLSAELASVRTRYEEREVERKRLRAKIAELTAQLDDAKREARSFEAEAHAARNELGEMKTAADIAARNANRREAEASALSQFEPPAESFEPESLAEEPRDEAPAAAPESPPAAPEGAPEGASGIETVSFMAALREGAPDDLTKIKGIGQKLEGTLNALGVYYYRQIADWTDAEIAEMDTKLKPTGRIGRDNWRGQARRLLGRES